MRKKGKIEKIVVFMSNFHDLNLTGQQKIGTHLVKNIEKSGIETLLISNNKNIGSSKYKELTNNTKVFLVSGEATFSTYIKNFFKINRAIKNFKPNLIHGHGTYSIMLTWFNGKILKIPVIQTIYEIKSFNGIFGKISIELLKSIEKIICNSGYIADYLIKNNIKNHKIEVLYYGVEDIWFKETKKKNYKKVLFFGDANYDRGVDKILKVIPKINKKFPNLEFVFLIRYFEDDLEFVIKEMSKKYPIKLIQRLPENTHISSLVRNSDIIVLPYRTTTIQPPLTLLEGMAIGNPIITTDVDANREFIGESERGILIQPDNSKQLEDAIINLIKNPEKGLKLGKRAKSFIKNRYNQSNLWNSIYRIYNECIECD